LNAKRRENEPKERKTKTQRGDMSGGTPEPPDCEILLEDEILFI